jgi:hypothetical protein
MHPQLRPTILRWDRKKADEEMLERIDKMLEIALGDQHSANLTVHDLTTKAMKESRMKAVRTEEKQTDAGVWDDATVRHGISTTLLKKWLL